jgi:hypothetical protein
MVPVSSSIVGMSDNAASDGLIGARITSVVAASPDGRFRRWAITDPTVQASGTPSEPVIRRCTLTADHDHAAGSVHSHHGFICTSVPMTNMGLH